MVSSSNLLWLNLLLVLSLSSKGKTLSFHGTNTSSNLVRDNKIFKTMLAIKKKGILVLHQVGKDRELVFVELQKIINKKRKVKHPMQQLLEIAKKAFNRFRRFLSSNIERLRAFLLLFQVVGFVLFYFWVDPFAGFTALAAGRLLLSALNYILGKDGRTGEDLGGHHYK